MISTEPVSRPAEIAVLVHASRTTKGQRIHEETSTVTVQPDGAVVRLKAKLPPGELIVLTNAQSKAHVICRVKHRPPGMPNCVDLEFIQLAPGFWNEVDGGGKAAGESAPGETVVARASADEPAAPAPKAEGAGDAPVAVAIAAKEDAAASPEPSPTPSHSAAARKPVWQQTRDAERLNALAADPVGSLPPPIGEAGALAPSRSAAVLGVPGLCDGPALYDRNDDYDDGGPRASTTKTGALVLVAAISIANGALLGAWVYKQMTRTDAAPQAAAQSIAAAAQPGDATVATAGTVIDPAIGAATVSLRAPGRASIPDTRQGLDRLSASVAATAVTPARRETAEETQPAPLIAEEAHAAAVMPEKLQAPRLKRALVIVQPDAPVVADEGRGLVQAGTAMGLLTPSAAAGPAPPAPTVGGRLTPMQLISSPPAIYPAAARTQHIEGLVTLDALVDETGKVTETTVLYGHPLLRDAAEVALRSWRYQPARLNGEAISMHTKVSIRFDLK